MPRLEQVHSIEAILFDMNGTLRMREPHPETQQAAYARLRQLLGKQDATDAYWDELSRRQKAYGRWAQENLLQLSEGEIWSRWLLPEESREQIEAIAPELMLAWSKRKGRHVPRSGAVETIAALKRRGYRLGIISNTMSTLDIPHSLEAFGIKEYFEVVILSSNIRCRKPAREPFVAAAEALQLEPRSCAYVGNHVNRDMVGCKLAGYALGIIIEPPAGQREEEPGQPAAPDLAIRELPELLSIFPGRA